MKVKYFKTFTTLFLLSLMLSLSTKSVSAIEYSGFGGKPAYPQSDNPRTESIFIHNIEPGKIVKDGVMVVNNSKDTKTLIIYAADSTPSTDGAFACKQFSEEKKDVGSWIDLLKEEVTLLPGTNKIIPFTISVPKNTNVGEHNGCILIQEKKKDGTNDTGLSLSIRTGIRVAITIPGNIIRKLEIEDFKMIKEGDVFNFYPKVKNSGNVSIDSEISVVTRSIFGNIIFKHGGDYPILRGETSSWNFQLKKPFWGGWYNSELIVKYDENSNASVGIKDESNLTLLKSETINFFSFPTFPALMVYLISILFIVSIIIIIVISQKRKKWILSTWVDYKARSTSNIILIAEKHNVSWKIIAKVNKLKPPYTFKSGQKIKVPPKEKKVNIPEKNKKDKNNDKSIKSKKKK